MKQYVVVDLEMCMEKGAGIKKMKGMRHEIIQIGAVMIEKHYQDEFQRTGCFVALAKGTLFTFVVNKKETGKFVL